MGALQAARAVSNVCIVLVVWSCIMLQGGHGDRMKGLLCLQWLSCPRSSVSGAGCIQLGWQPSLYNVVYIQAVHLFSTL